MIRSPKFSHWVYFLKVKTIEQIKLTKNTPRTNCAPGKGINPPARKKKELKNRSWAALFVVAQIVANPVSNVFQKQLTQRSANPLFIIGATDALLALAVLPLFFLGAVPLALAPGF